MECAGRFLVFSDIPNDRQMRWIEEDGHLSTFRKPSNFTNGNTFDWEGRLICCEHLARRVVRLEHNGEESPCWPTSGKRNRSECAQRRGGPSRRRHLVHRSRLWNPGPV